MRRLIYRIKEFFNHDIYWLKWWCQRAKRGYADCDIWSLDYYLNSWLPHALRKLKEISHGYPSIDEASTPEKWDSVLEEMALGFEAVARVSDTKNWIMNEGSEMYSIPCKDNPYLSEIKFTNEWTQEQIKHFRELDKNDMATFKHGMKLFTKFYMNLWD